MVTINKSIFKGIFLIGTLLAFNCQQAMEEKKKKKTKVIERQLRQIATIDPGIAIEKIKLCTISNDTIEKLGCPRNYKSNYNDIIIICTKNTNLYPDTTIKEIKEGEVNTGSIILFDLKNKKKIDEITYQDIFNSPACSSLDDDEHCINMHPMQTIITEIKGCPFLNLISSKKNKVIRYNLTKKEFKLFEMLQLQKQFEPTELEIELKMLKQKHSGVNMITHSTTHKTIGNYFVKKERDKLFIQYKNNQREIVINLPEYINKNSLCYRIFTNNKQEGQHLLLQREECGQTDGVYKCKVKKYLYNLKTEKLINEFENFKKLSSEFGCAINDVIFGKNEDFMVLVSDCTLILYNLNTLMPEAKFCFNKYEGPSNVHLSSNEKQIIFFTPHDNIIHVLHNPLAKTEDPDEPERIEYLQKEKCPRTNGEKEFFIKIGGKKIKVDKTFLFS